MLIRFRAWADNARSSLFYLPAIFVLVTVAATFVVADLDERYAGTFAEIPFLLTASVNSARSVLSTIAGATITVAGIVFSVTMVSVQLASSQFSPRVLRGFLRDRFSQVIMGVVVSTFTYCLLLLTQTRASGFADGEPTVQRNLGLTIAVVMAVVAVLAILAFIDHSARAMQVGQVIARVADETRDRIAQSCPPAGERPAAATADISRPSGTSHTVTAPRFGWVTQLDAVGIFRAVPPGTSIRLDVRVGSFVAEGSTLATLWPEPEDPDAVRARVAGAFAFGRGRTMQQDILFGIRQLVDIGLRALSPGVNDPTTAYDVIVNLESVIGDLLRRDLPPRIEAGPDGRVLYRPGDVTHNLAVDRAFDQIRVASTTQPSVAIAILGTLGRLLSLLERAELSNRAAPLHRQAELVVAGIAAAGHLPEDVDRVRQAAVQARLVPAT